MISINVKYFGMLSEMTGVDSETIQLDEGSSSTDLNTMLISKYVELEKYDFKLALNMEVVNSGNVELNNEDEVALLPPYAGG